MQKILTLSVLFLSANALASDDIHCNVAPSGENIEVSCDQSPVTFWQWMQRPYTPQESRLASIEDNGRQLDSVTRSILLHNRLTFKYIDFNDIFHTVRIASPAATVGLVISFPGLFSMWFGDRYIRGGFLTDGMMFLFNLVMTPPTIGLGGLAMVASTLPLKFYVNASRFVQYMTRTSCRRALATKGE